MKITTLVSISSIVKYPSLLFFLLTLTVLNSQATLQLETTTLVERELTIGLTVPWEMTWGPDDHIWLTERVGNIKRVNPVNGNVETVLGFENMVDNYTESGMLGMCFHPDFNVTPLLYVVYDYGPNVNNLTKRLVTFEWNGSELSNEKILLDGIRTFKWHSGCRLLITPDNKLLMTLGDISESEHSQDMSSILGKILRINLDGSIPDDNPFPGSMVYSYGHRNAQGLAYGPHGILYSSEHGPNQSDEFNIIEAGRNYGWPNVVGKCDSNSELTFCTQNNVVEPLTEWSPCVAVNDLCYYTHDAIPEWKDKMLMAVLGGFVRRPALTVFDLSEDGRSIEQMDNYFEDYGRLRDVCFNPKTGAIYLATNGSSYPSFGPNRIVEYFNPDFETSNLNVIADLNQSIKISPNPIKSNQPLNVTFSNSFIGQTTVVFDYSGRELLKFEVIKNNMIIDLAELPEGPYYLMCQSKKGAISKKFVVVR